MPRLAAAEFIDVAKDYPARWPWGRRTRAVMGLSFRIEAGEVFGLVGPNRAGKTTLVKLLLSLCRPTSGQVLRFGRQARDRGTLARVGYVHERPALPPYLSAAGLLDYCGALWGLSRAVVRSRSGILLDRVGLADRVREPIRTYSKGMLQRLALAQALLNEPDLLVLDEPHEGLDAAGRQLVREVIEERRSAGQTVLLVSHVLDDVERLSDRVAILVQGRLARFDVPARRDTGWSEPAQPRRGLAEVFAEAIA